MSAGRPALFENPDLMDVEIQMYFNITNFTDITITGLAYFLGFESRQSFYDYEERPEFSYIIKRARLYIESAYEKKLSGNSVTGSIFALKNMGWKDKQEVEHVNERFMLIEKEPDDRNEQIPD